ncbi:MAG TPA: Gfo/Idh/MocA family oxidoreductase, partial [Flavisolibacter sp.]|nr:Gfo/Idh/MocA family oxidoreductase [Flavisolibacter sp.]
AKTDVQEAMLQANVSPASTEWGIEPESEKGLLHTEIDGKIIREYIPSLRGNYGDYYQQVYKSIRENQPVPVSGNDGLNVIRIIEKAFESNNEKRVIPV